MGHRPKTANRLSHVVFVVDESGSMSGLTEKVKAEILAQIDTMVKENTEADHEIRASLYTFQGEQWGARTRDDHVHCVLYDMDVLRMKEVLTLPAMKDWYQPDGLTALIDATCKAIDELGETAQRYGEHNFLVYVVTDGAENASVTPAHVLQNKLHGMKSNWTVGALVPNQRGATYAKELGFDPESILIWDATSAAGLATASKAMQTATSTILRSHRTGTKPTGGLFSTGAEAVNSQTVQAAGLVPVPKDEYERLYAHQKERIDALVDEKSTDLPYKRGNGFYQLTKRETIQAHKKLLVWDREKKVLLHGGVRSLLNLPEGVDVTIPKPQDNDRYEVYVQSGADNRVIPEKAHAVIVRDKAKLA